MVFEKSNDNQIKCVLDKEDLISRNINIKDLFYGSPKTEQLFKDVVSRAQANYDFNKQKLPISIDAIPLPNDTLVIIITIAEEPEEIDSRFSRFTPDPNAASDKLFSSKADTSAGPEDIFSFFSNIANQISNSSKDSPEDSNLFDSAKNDFSSFDSAIAKDPDGTMLIIFKFENIDKIIELSNMLMKIYNDNNSLYKLGTSYYLFVYNTEHNEETFLKICDLISEYGNPVINSPTTSEHILEHAELIIADTAIQELSQI